MVFYCYIWNFGCYKGPCVRLIDGSYNKRLLFLKKKIKKKKSFVFLFEKKKKKKKKGGGRFPKDKKMEVEENKK